MCADRGITRGSGYAIDPLLGKIFEIDHENLEFRGKQNPGDAPLAEFYA
jgi:hypothetical protein